MPAKLEFIDSIMLACLEKNPINFSRVDEAEVKRTRAAIKRATTPKGAVFRDPVRRNDILCACLEFTSNLREEHLIVGYGFRHGATTLIERLHHVVGEKHRVKGPEYISAEITRHHYHRDDAEVVVFHNHPSIGDEPGWFSLLKTLMEDKPIASHQDRIQVLRHALTPVGLARGFLGGGRVLFFLGENGFVREFHLPPLLPFVDQFARWQAGRAGQPGS